MTATVAIAGQVASAGTELQVGDQIYQLFLSSLPPSIGFKPPPSAWFGQPGSVLDPGGSGLLHDIQNAAVTTPVTQIKVVSVTTNPEPVSKSGAIQVQPDAPSMTLDVTVANTGNQPANNLTVTISPIGHGASLVRDFVNLAVGQAYTVSGLGPLNPAEGVPTTLAVDVLSPTASTVLATQSVQIEMPAAAIPTTSTTAS